MTMNDYCAADEVTLQPTNLTTYSVSKQQAVAEFTPRGYNCSIRSLDPTTKPVWKLTDLTVNRTIHLTGNMTHVQDEAGFWYNNTARDSDPPMSLQRHGCIEKSGVGPRFDGSTELLCPGLDEWVPTWYFNYNTSTLTMVQDWACDGVDMFHV